MPRRPSPVDPDLAEAHAALGMGSLLYRMEICRGSGRTQARAAALAVEPDGQRSAGASGGLSWSISKRLRSWPDRRLNSTRSLIKPGTSLARVLFAEGKLDEAEAAARKAAELQPTAAGNHRWQVFVAIQRGDGEAALREAQLEPNEGYQTFRTRARALCARGAPVRQTKPLPS